MVLYKFLYPPINFLCVVFKKSLGIICSKDYSYQAYSPVLKIVAERLALMLYVWIAEDSNLDSEAGFIDLGILWFPSILLDGWLVPSVRT
jgi:hypothetical protein